jgi:prepilin-type processing-associated H-X9-DG protein
VVVTLVAILVLALALPACRRVRTDASRQVCLAHLGEIGRAMLLYANDNGGKFPQPGGRHSRWGTVPRWHALTRQSAFGTAADGSGGQASISSAFYLLVKYAQLKPRDCICPGDVGSTDFELSGLRDLPEGFQLTDAWDFGPDAPLHCSYAYHSPFGAYVLSTSSDPGMAVAADRSPWLLTPKGEPGQRALFPPDPVGTREPSEVVRWGNSPSHGRDGQNVLFVDGHVSFESQSDCGLDHDNIYTVSNDIHGRGSPAGSLPAMSMLQYRPANRRDSLLLHDPGPFTARTIPQASEVDSRSLQQTMVVATLDCPLPEDKNAIWCSTFQMAWDKFKDDLVGEPIKLLGAEDLAGRLNQGAFPTADIEPRSYYANAGFVKDGIIGQIRKDMAIRFPGESLPAFDSRYTELPDVAMAFAYLNVDIGFACPYYVNDRPFAFTPSQGRRTDVTSFSTSAPYVNNAMVREQVDILHYEFRDTPHGDEFIVDLSIHTQPYQIILARMPRGKTLGESLRVMQERITKFKDDPDYAALSKLRPIDSLTVPDVLFKLTHHYQELLGKHLGNDKWRGNFIFEAMQKIDFSLSRTGVVLKSEAIMGAPASRSPEQLAKPRHLRFDKPFLICVKKRQPDATPFFLMWVDNAELMQAATAGQ